MSNIMIDVAALLGVELGESCKKRTNGKVMHCNFVHHEDGLSCILEGEEENRRYWLEDLLTGKAEIVKLPWRPKKGELYYRWKCSDITGGQRWQIIGSEWDEDTYDIANLAMGNCFRTREEAEAHIDKVIKRYREALEERS